MKTYRIDIKKFLQQANWQHEHFGIIAKFFGGKDASWEVTEDMLTEIAETTQ